MKINEKLLYLRKKSGLSQEELAEKLKVTRQTISKWETGESKPDFDKIIPICELYNISSEELLRDKIEENNVKTIEDNQNNLTKKTAFVLSASIFIYFISIIWIIVAESMELLKDEIIVAIFLLICAFPTCWIIYHFASRSKKEKEEAIEKHNEAKEKYEKTDTIINLIFLTIYLIISFLTFAWHITWIIWLIDAIVIEISHTIIDSKDGKNDN